MVNRLKRYRSSFAESSITAPGRNFAVHSTKMPFTAVIGKNIDATPRRRGQGRHLRVKMLCWWLG